MKTLFTFCLLLLTYWLPAQKVKYTFEKQRLLLGEQMQLKIDAIVSEGIQPPFFSIDSLPHFEVLQKSKMDTVGSGGKLKLSQTFLITSWDSGRWTLPTLITNGQPSKPIFIDVVYTTPWSPGKPYNDIKGIVPVANPGRDSWWWYVIGIAVLVGLFLLFFPQGKSDKTVSEIDSNAYKKAMQSLDKLQAAGIADAKQYYTELILIFRTYLKGAKGIQSFSKTTDDISIQLQSMKPLQADYNALLQTLRLSDLVKFAQYQPEENVKGASLQTIKQSIQSIEGHAV